MYAGLWVNCCANNCEGVQCLTVKSAAEDHCKYALIDVVGSLTFRKAR